MCIVMGFNMAPPPQRSVGLFSIHPPPYGEMRVNKRVYPFFSCVSFLFRNDGQGFNCQPAKEERTWRGGVDASFAILGCRTFLCRYLHTYCCTSARFSLPPGPLVSLQPSPSSPLAQRSGARLQKGSSMLSLLYGVRYIMGTQSSLNM